MSSGDDARADRGRRPGLPEPVPVRRLVPRRARARCSRPGERFGAGGADRAERILIEFVSANPTGPLVAASGRHAAYGDALARILEHHGHDGLARVLLQRRRRPDPAAGRVGPGPGAWRGGARGRLPGRVRASSWPRRSPARPSATSTRWPAQAVELLLAQIKATLERYGVHFDTFFCERDAARGLAERSRAGAGDRSRRPGTSYRSEGALWLRTTTLRRRQGPRGRALERRADLPRRRHRLPAQQARARLRAPADAGRRRPPRLRARAEGGDGRARRRPRRGRGADPPVRAPGRGRRACGDVQAARRVRDARRPARRDRRRRDAVLHAAALARPDARPRSRRSRASSRPRTPSTTSSTRTRGSPRCCGSVGAERVAAATGAPGRLGRRRRSQPVRAGAGQEARRVPRGGRRGGATGARRTGSPPTRSSWPRTSPRSTATAGWSARRRRRSSRSGSRCRLAAQRTIALSLGLLGVSAPDSM